MPRLFASRFRPAAPYAANRQVCLSAVLLVCLSTAKAEETHLAQLNTDNLVSLRQQYSLSDIAQLRAQARGQSQHAFIAYPALILNGSTTSQMLPVQVYGEELAVDTEALAALGVALPASSEQWQSLDDLGIAGRYDNNAQQISLVVPADWLPEQSLSAGLNASTTPLQRGRGALLNYDAYGTWYESGGQNPPASHELRLFDDWGAVSSSGVVRWDDAMPDNKGDYVRLDSYWRYTRIDRMQTWIAGDTLSGALAWTPSVRLAGLQLSRNFASRPDLITFPLPSISGSATLPSALEVFVNDLRLADQTVQPGPFVLETSPRITGLGEVQVVTTDTLGRQVTNTVPFYVSPTLLREGLWDYSASIGTPRRFYGQRSNDYDGQPVATGIARYGMTPQYTLESTANVSDTLVNAGLGLVARPGLWGVSNIALAHGQDDDSQGIQWNIGHEFRTRRFGVSGQYTRRNQGYRDLSNSLDVRPSIKSTLQLNGSLNLDRYGSLNATYLDTRLFRGERSRFLVLGHSRTLQKRLSLTLSVNQNLDDSSDRTWSAGLNLFLDRPGKRPLQSGLQVTHDEESGDTQSIATLSQRVDEFWDLGWDLAMSPQSDGAHRASARWWTPYADLQAGVYGDNGQTNSFANLSGSVVTNYGDLFAANTMNNSFAIVDAGGFADLPVRRANRIIGHTNHRGRLLLPDLIPYTDNKLTIDIDDLPMDAQLSETDLIIKPAELAGVTARFAIEQQHSAILVLVREDGSPVPAGARVLHSDANATLVGYDGEAFLQGLHEGENEIGIISNGSLCTVRLDFVPNPGTLPRLGPYTCLSPSSPAQQQTTP